jgi:hypothetical protein
VQSARAGLRFDMRSIISVTTPATVELLTTVERVQSDLGITGSETEIETAISEASSRIEAELGYHLALEVVVETFRPVNGYSYGSAVLLERTPVVEINSITVDGTVLAEADWDLQPENGRVIWLSAGMSTWWRFSSALAVAYSGGWVMPGEEDRTLPPAIEAAAVAYVRSVWSSRQAGDSMLRAVEIPGVIRREYYSSNRAGGESTLLPPDVASMLAPFKRMRV